MFSNSYYRHFKQFKADGGVVDEKTLAKVFLAETLALIFSVWSKLLGKQLLAVLVGRYNNRMRIVDMHLSYLRQKLTRFPALLCSGRRSRLKSLCRVTH